MLQPEGERESGNFDNNQKKNKASKTINKPGFCFVLRGDRG